MAGIPSWEVWVAENHPELSADDPGIAGSARRDPARPAEVEGWEDTPEGQVYKKAHRYRQAWFGAHNEWLDLFTKSGQRPSEQGIFDKKEHGQSIFRGWDQNWDSVQNDPLAKAFQADPNFQGFVNAYEHPWVAFDNWKRLRQQQKQFNPQSSSDLQRLPGGGFFDTVGGGENRKPVFFDQFGRETSLGGLAAPGGGGSYTFGGGQFPRQSQGGVGSGGVFRDDTTAPVTGGGGMASNTAGFDPFEEERRRRRGLPGPQGFSGESGGVPGAPAPQPGPRPSAPAPGAMGGITPYYQPTGFSIPGFGGAMSPSFNFDAIPTFDAPDYEAPTAVTMQNDPGFQFRLQQGRDALEASAAARGVLRSGGTLQDIVKYGQDLASQEFQNVNDRYNQGFDRRLAAARAEFDPKFAGWQTLTNAELQRGMGAFNREFDVYQLMQQLYPQWFQIINGQAGEAPRPSDFGL